jgi:holo-[acyl-carrier protein] synthase
MVFGIGTDVVRVPRMARLLARSGGALAERVLGPQERELYQERSGHSRALGLRYLATRFAAKEAFAKAIGLGLREPLTWQAVETTSEPGGRPVLVFSGPLAAWMTERKLRAHLSLTDEETLAVAFVVVERVEDGGEAANLEERAQDGN